MNRVINYFTNYLINENIIKESEYEIYQYGLLVAMEMFLSLITILVLNIVLGIGYEGVVFLIVFISVRTFSGGMHLEKFYNCYFCSSLTYVACIKISKYLILPNGLCLMVGVVLATFTFAFTPVKQYNMDICLSEQKKMKKNVRKVLLFWMLCNITLLFTGYMKTMIYIESALLLNFISMLWGRIYFIKKSRSD